jgi:uncharacterized protein
MAGTSLRWLLTAGTLLATTGYLLLLALIWLRQEDLIFYPQPLPAGHHFAFGDDVQELWFDVPGARLHALHLRLQRPDGVVFYLHGNAGNLQNWFVNADFYRQLNLDLVMLDYRGYGKSGGRIGSQAQLLSDVRAAWDGLAPVYAGRRRIVFGRSLGTGPAAMLAADVQPELTVLVSPYTSLRSLAAEHYPWVPGALLRYPLDTGEAVTRIRGPLLLAHGERDTLIPPSHSRRLLAVAPRAQLLLVAEAGHDNLHEFPAYLEGLRHALRGP